MRVLIVEDEAPAARRLRRLVAADLAVDPDDIAIADTLEKARQFIAGGHTDLLLLDLDLSGRDGFDVLRGICSAAPPTIIVSANTDRAVAAFDHEVIDFVAKPVSAERLSRALARAKDARAGEARLVIRAQGRTDIVPIGVIVRLSGAGDYVEVTTAGGQTYLHDEKLNILEKRLPPSFMRVHRSHIVNMVHVAQLRHLERGRRIIITHDGGEIPISRRRVNAVSTAFASI